VLILKIAFRNIFRQKKRTVFTGLSVIGGVTLAIIFIGWADGSYNNIINQFTRDRLGHIQIHEKTYIDRPSLYKTIPDLSRIEAILAKTPEAVGWAPRIYSAGLAALGEKSAGVEIIGIDPEKETRIFRFDKRIIRGRSFSGPESKEAVLGQGLAEILQAKPGDDVIVLTQAADGSVAADNFSVVGVASSGDETSDRISLYTPLERAQNFLVLEGKVHEIAVVVSRLDRVPAVNALLSKEINDPKLAVDPWQIFAKSFYEAMKADKAGMWLFLVVVVIIVAVGVLNTVLMSVLERRREYGLLKAVGTKPGQIIRLILLEIIILSVISVIIGSGLGFGANVLLSRHGIRFSHGLTYGGMVFDTMKSELNVRSFTIPAAAAFISAILVSLFPALKASRTEPARTMRMH
jgi:putative ABC transport system permease protein